MVSYNRDTKLKESISNLLTTSFDELVIVDNNSRQETRDILNDMSQKDNRVTIIQLNENKGASHGFYTGLKYVENKYEASVTTFLDDDACFEQDFLDELKKNIALCEQKYAFITPRVINKNGVRLTMNRPMTIIPNTIAKMYRYLMRRRTFGDNNEPVEAASFIGLTILNSTRMNKSELIPVDYFIYYDDLTFSYRLTKYHGGLGFYYDDMVVIHDIEGGTREYDTFRLSYLLSNSIKFSKEVGDTLRIYPLFIHCFHFLKCVKKFNLMVFIKSVLRKR